MFQNFHFQLIFCLKMFPSPNLGRGEGVISTFENFPSFWCFLILKDRARPLFSPRNTNKNHNVPYKINNWNLGCNLICLQLKKNCLKKCMKGFPPNKYFQQKYLFSNIQIGDNIYFLNYPHPNNLPTKKCKKTFVIKFIKTEKKMTYIIFLTSPL